MSDEIRVGVIGVGLIGRLHMDGYAKAGAKVVAVVDPHRATAEAAAATCNATVYTDYEEMLANEELQAVSICSPPIAHREAAVAAALRGLAVLCEKPLAESTASARELADAVAATGVPFMVGFFHRFHDPLVTLRQMISDGTFGQQLIVRSRFSLIGREDLRPWASEAAIAGGGAVMNSAVHSLDVIRFLTGSEMSVDGAVLSARGTAGTLEDMAVVLLHGTSGETAIVEAYGGAAFKTYDLWLEGPDGEATVSWDPPGLRVRTLAHPDWKEIPTSATSPLDRIDRAIDYFCACLREGRQIDQATGADGVRAVELAQSVYRVAK